MDDKTTGSWLIHHTQRLQRVETQRGFERIYKAGKAGILLSAISGDAEREISSERVEALAAAANINTVFELPALLQTLKERELIDSTPNGVAVLGVSTQKTLQHAAKIFELSGPTANERLALDVAEEASQRPVTASEAVNQIGDRHRLTASQAQQTISESADIGFVDVENIGGGEQLLFNGNLFRRDSPAKMKRVLDSLTAGERRALSEVTEHLQKRACMEVADVERMLGASLFQKVMAVGLFDLNVVSNTTEETGFITLPSAFRKYSTAQVEDAFDLAKAFVSSITYGMTKSSSSRGRIDLVQVLLRTLIRGEPVGPVPAIGQDYKILELKGVVQVRQGSKKGRSGPMLYLLKKEVGELALQVITQGDVSEHSLDALPSAAVTRYKGPEENQQRARRKQLRNDAAGTNDILRVLRTSGGV